MKTIAVLLNALLILQACSKRELPIEADSIVHQDGARLVIATNSPFYRKLEIAPVVADVSKIESFRSVGQIAALGEAPASLIVGQKPHWLELEPAFSRQMGLDPSLISPAKAGLAIGVTWIAKDEYLQIKNGERVNIRRYGLKDQPTPATLFLLKPEERLDSNKIALAFVMRDASTWYPGTTCFVEYPLLRSSPLEIPSLSVLHEGTGEYVFIELKAGNLEAIPVTILHESGGMAEVIAPFKKGDRLVESGAILLKPFLKSLIEVETAGHRAP